MWFLLFVFEIRRVSFHHSIKESELKILTTVKRQKRSLFLRKQTLLQINLLHHLVTLKLSRHSWSCSVWCIFYLRKVVLLNNVEAQSSGSICLVQAGHINQAGFTHNHNKQSGSLILEIENFFYLFIFLHLELSNLEKEKGWRGCWVSHHTEWVIESILIVWAFLSIWSKLKPRCH